MRVNDNCRGCGLCIPYCPQCAIFLLDRAAHIDRNLCVECGVCIDSNICPHNSFAEDNDERATIKKYFGRLVANIPGEKKVGRGGGFDVKTNDVTGILPQGKVVVRLELNRPGGGVKFKYVEGLRAYLKDLDWDVRVSKRHQKLADAGFVGSAGEQRILSGYVELIIEPERLPQLVKQTSEYISGKKIWVAVSAACVYGVMPALEAALAGTGLAHDLGGKYNLGLGGGANHDPHYSS